MKPKPGKQSPEERRSKRLQYAHMKIQGLRPFAGAKLMPWERRLLARSLGIVLKTKLGYDRKPDQTAETVTKIIPVAARELKPAMKDILPEDQYKIVCRLLDWYAENPKEFPGKSRFPPGFCPKEIVELGQKLSQNSFLRISGILFRQTFFRIKNEERPEHRNKPDLKKDLEFHLKHDIAHALWFTRAFLESVSNPQKT